MSTLRQQTHAAFDAGEAVLSSRALWVGLVALLLGFQLFLIWSHKPWADELQALMIALEAPDNATLLAWLHYEGHPPLWYWLLRALGSFAEPHIVLPLAATLCATITQGAILFASPFSRLERLLIASSQFFLFEFLTISRGTSLGVMLVVLAMVFWRSRWFWVVMALLPLVDFLFGVLSGVFLVLKWRERDLWLPGIALWLSGSAIAGWSVIPASDMVSAFDAMQPMTGMELFMDTLQGWFLKMGSMFIPFQGGLSPQWNSPVVPIASWAWVLLLAVFWFATKDQPWHALMLFGFVGFTLVFSLVLYPIGLRHLMLAALLLIALTWLARLQDTAPSAAFRSWLMLAAICGVASSVLSTTRGFENADAVLAEIEKRGLSDKHWIALPEWRVPAVTGRSSMAFARPEEDCLFRFVRWDHKSEALTGPDAFRAMLQEEIAQHGRSYLLSDMSFNGFDPALIQRLTSVDAAYNGMEYHLYVVGPQAPEMPVKLPFCYAQAPD